MGVLETNIYKPPCQSTSEPDLEKSMNVEKTGIMISTQVG